MDALIRRQTLLSATNALIDTPPLASDKPFNRHNLLQATNPTIDTPSYSTSDKPYTFYKPVHLLKFYIFNVLFYLLTCLCFYKWPVVPYLANYVHTLLYIYPYFAMHFYSLIHTLHYLLICLYLPCIM